MEPRSQGMHVRNEARADRRPVIGIVGGIGSGKSEVARIFASLGCEVCESDGLARRVLAEPAVVSEVDRLVREATGHGVVRAVVDDGDSEERAGEVSRRVVDRALLARAIFAAPALRSAVEGVMHPRIEALRREQFARAPATAPAFVIDAPLLLEVGLERECDAVIFVDAPREQRLVRVAQGRGWAPDELARRESAQLPLEEKRRRSTHVIVNDGSREGLRAQVEAVLRSICTG